MAAVLDMKWSAREHLSHYDVHPFTEFLRIRASDTLAVADAEGHIILYRWKDTTVSSSATSVGSANMVAAAA